MKKTRPVIMGTCHILLLLMMLILLAESCGYVNVATSEDEVVRIVSMEASVDGGPFHTVNLPHVFTSLDPLTPVTLRATIYPQEDDVVYLKSVYAPAKVYLNDILFFQFADPQNYPSFMIDSATEHRLLETDGNGSAMRLRIDFLSPTTRRSLAVHPPLVGTSKEVILERAHALGIPMILSMTQIIYGFSLIFICVCLLLVDKKGIAFLWLGLLSLMTGLWSFGENNFSGMIFKNATLLYVLSFIGMFTFIIPLLRFVRSIVDFEHPKVLWYTELGLVLINGIVMALQLGGIVAFNTSVYVFHLVLPLVLIFLAVITTRESIRYKNKIAQQFILPVSILALSAILELLNYKVLFTSVFSSLFQMGMMIFLLVMGVTAGMAVKDSNDLKAVRKELAFQEDLMKIQIKEQESRSKLLSHHEQLLSQQRHDLRHHLAAISELASPDNQPLQEYLSSLMEAIPKSSKKLCENRAVNAVLAHYVIVCKSQGIRLELELAVPPCSDGITDSELCVIFGNLLENACEACSRMTEGEKFIKLCTSVHTTFLTITMDNSFNGTVHKDEKGFLSSKRDSYGIGLASVANVAKKHGGDAEFKPQGHVFFSSVYFQF